MMNKEIHRAIPTLILTIVIVIFVIVNNILLNGTTSHLVAFFLGMSMGGTIIYNLPRGKENANS